MLRGKMDCVNVAHSLSQPPTPRFFAPLVEAYEQLDPEGGFSNLSTLLETQVTAKYKERRALDRLTEIVRAMKADLGVFSAGKMRGTFCLL